MGASFTIGSVAKYLTCWVIDCLHLRGSTNPNCQFVKQTAFAPPSNEKNRLHPQGTIERADYTVAMVTLLHVPQGGDRNNKTQLELFHEEAAAVKRE